MSNQYFQFKLFRVEQGECAMKITTDACIQGAWTPIPPNVKRVLDIGAGTGILSLMLAQRSPDIIIDAIELDAKAVAEAGANVSRCPWKHRINVLDGDIRTYDLQVKYDLIICNPPFFSNSLLGNENSRNIARHTTSLSIADLIDAINCHTNEEGCVSILLPFTGYPALKEKLEGLKWKETDRLLVRHTDSAEVKRVVGVFSRLHNVAETEHNLAIKDAEGKYTPSFIKLLAPFYLNL